MKEISTSRKSCLGSQTDLLTNDIPILVYHQITSEFVSSYAIPAHQFEQQMHFLRDQGYQCLPMEEYIQGLNASRAKKAFVITFDDGYKDFLDNAFPILDNIGFTATIFLPVNYIGQSSEWPGAIKAPLLDWEQIRDLSKAGISFGSHTCTHPRLLSKSAMQVRAELVTSRQILEKELNKEVKLLAYPYGESNLEIQGIALEAGYKAACGVVTGTNSLFNIWRRPCEAGDTPRAFHFKLTRNYLRYLQLRKWMREDTAIGRSLRALKYRRYDKGQRDGFK